MTAVLTRTPNAASPPRPRSAAKDRAFDQYKALVYAAATGGDVDEDALDAARLRADFSIDAYERHVATARERIEANQAIASAKGAASRREKIQEQSAALEAEIVAAEADPKTTLGQLRSLKLRAQMVREHLQSANEAAPAVEAIRNLNRTCSKQFREKFAEASNAACTLETKRRELFREFSRRCGIRDVAAPPREPDIDSLTAPLVKAISAAEQEIARLEATKLFEYGHGVMENATARLAAAQEDLQRLNKQIALYRQIVGTDLPAALERKAQVEQEMFDWANFDW